MNDGLVGRWTPGIGDPSLGGWLTVLLYFLAGVLVWRLLTDQSRLRRRITRRERWFWQFLLVGLILLGINKQLDLQSAFTEMGRMLADAQGWYSERRQVQAAFIAGIGIMGATLLAAALYLIWDAPAPTHWALAGSTGLVLFVLVRAASFHHVDELLDHSLTGLRINWVIEMGALLVIMACAIRRRGQQ